MSLKLTADYADFLRRVTPFNKFSDAQIRLAPLLYWKAMSRRHPELAKVAEVALSVSAGSCSVERANSHQKQIMDPQRASLDHRRVNRDMKIRLNLQKLRKIEGTSLKKQKK